VIITAKIIIPITNNTRTPPFVLTNQKAQRIRRIQGEMKIKKGIKKH
jgi:hypothetical protein